jgi:hypothetical protein
MRVSTIRNNQCFCMDNHPNNPMLFMDTTTQCSLWTTTSTTQCIFLDNTNNNALYGRKPLQQPRQDAAGFSYVWTTNTVGFQQQHTPLSSLTFRHNNRLWTTFSNHHNVRQQHTMAPYGQTPWIRSSTLRLNNMVDSSRVSLLDPQGSPYNHQQQQFQQPQFKQPSNSRC